MSEPDLETQHKELQQALGGAVLAWAYVEFQLSLIYADSLGGNPSFHHAIFGKIRSFDNKLEFAHIALTHVFPDESEQSRIDWRVLKKEASKLGDLRNEIIHSLALNVEGKMAMLEPFFELPREKERLSIADVLNRKQRFQSLSDAMGWFHMRYISPGGQPPGFQLPDHDLILRLRKIDEKTRAKQKPHGQS